MPKDSSGKKPRKPGRVAQVRAAYVQARQVDPKIGWWMLLAFLVVLGVAVGIGLLLGAPVYAGILGVPLGALAATIVMTRRAQRAAYRQIEGQPGAAGAALSGLRGGWFTDAQPVAVEAARGMDLTDAGLVFRAVGRPGVVLVGEGPSGRAQKALAAERRKVERLLPGVPVTVYRVGSGKGDEVVALSALTGRIQRMKPVLTKAEVATVNKRLRALGGVRPPLPQGFDPTKARMDRRALRGR